MITENVEEPDEKLGGVQASLNFLIQMENESFYF